MKPKRIQRKRTKGWKMPEGAVYVGRPTKWGNPYRCGIAAHFNANPHVNTVLITSAGFVKAFREYAERCVECEPNYFEELRGKDLACWCPLDRPCHADVILEFANLERK